MLPVSADRNSLRRCERAVAKVAYYFTVYYPGAEKTFGSADPNGSAATFGRLA